MTTTSTQTVDIAPADENELVIHLIRKSYFCAHWADDGCVGPTCAEHGVRGQHFIGNLDAFTAQHIGVGMRIRYI